MKISVIILSSVENIDILLNYGLPAIRNQSYNDYEIIVVYNGFARFGELKQLTNGIKVIQTETRNRAKGRNIGADNSQGEILTFIDGDSIANRYYLENVITYFNKKGVGVVFGYEERLSLDEFSKKIDELNKKIDNEYKKIKWSIASSNNFSCLRQMFFDIGKFDENFEGWGFEDTELFYRLSLRNQSLFIDKALKVFHIHHPSDGSEKIRQQAKKNLIYFAQKHGIDVILKDPQIRKKATLTLDLYPSDKKEAVEEIINFEGLI